MDYRTKFLVVDDMEGMRRILTNSLHQLGMQNIVTAANGAEAWRKIETLTVDVVISDWNMPVMSGLELLKKIRASAQHATGNTGIFHPASAFCFPEIMRAR